MYKRPFKGTGLNVSLLGLGCMRLPKINSDSEAIDTEKAQEIVDYAYSHGINYFDTAYMYHGGASESFIGPALKKYPRESYFLTTKMPIWMAKEPADLEKIFNTQLERCQTDYFDFYLFHSLNKDHFKQCVDFGLYDFLCQKRKEGKVRYIGFSFHDSADFLPEIVRTYKWDFAQIQLNYLDWEMQNAKKQYEILESNGIPCIIMEPVRGGTLANPCDAANELFKNTRPDKSIASWAIRYAATLPNVLTVLSGMSNLDQIKDNVKTMTDFEPLTKEDYKVIEKAVEAYKTKDTVPCTGCRYCMDCAFGVDIPKMFKLYNAYAVDKDKESYKTAYAATEESERVDNCVACGNCMTHCPQAIQIPDKLAMIKDLTKELLEK